MINKTKDFVKYNENKKNQNQILEQKLKYLDETNEINNEIYSLFIKKMLQKGLLFDNIESIYNDPIFIKSLAIDENYENFDNNFIKNTVFNKLTIIHFLLKDLEKKLYFDDTYKKYITDNNRNEKEFFNSLTKVFTNFNSLIFYASVNLQNEIN